MGIKPRTVIHVGSHLAQDQIQYDSLGVNEVIWCEADEECVSIIRERYPQSKTIEGLFWSEKNKEIDFWIMKDRAQNTVFRPLKMEGSQTKVPLLTTTLDAEFLHSDLLSPIMLVLDVQGAELHVLKGGAEFLNKVEYLVCEITEQSTIAQFSILQNEVENILHPYGFVPKLKRPSYNKEYYDLLFVRSGIFLRLRITAFDILFKLLKIRYKRSKT